MKGNDWQQKTLNEFAEYPVPESVNVIKKFKFLGKNLVWLTTSGYPYIRNINPVFINSGLAVG
jgi:hypothetical protein